MSLSSECPFKKKFQFGWLFAFIDNSKWEWNQSVFDLESASFSELAFTSSGFGENVFTVIAGYYSLGVTENGCSLVASSTFNIHEVGVGGGNETFKFVALALGLEYGVQKVSVHVVE